MKIEMTREEFAAMVAEHWRLRNRVRELETRPFRGSIDHMASEVANAVVSLTSDQRGALWKAIRDYVG